MTLLTKNSSISGADRDICPIRMDTHYLSAPIIMGINQRGLIMGKFTTKDLTQDRLKELLHYCPETGVFTWIKTNGSRGKKGNIAGSINPIGYLDIGVDSKVYKAHRLAFLYVEGYFPEYGLDHINRNKSDNRWSNLRQVSQTCNMRNVKKERITQAVWLEFVGIQQGVYGNPKYILIIKTCVLEHMKVLKKQ